MMAKKLAMVAVLAVAAYGGAKWKQRHDAHDGRGRSLATNRFWIDHAPVNERDRFNVFVVHTPEGLGAFAEETQWKGQIERFRFDMDGNTIHAAFPWTDTREDIKVDARPCHEQGMDYCLELTGSSHGVARYYSLIGWERKSGEDIEAFKTRAFAR
jgi:hypothetical protein